MTTASPSSCAVTAAIGIVIVRAVAGEILLGEIPIGDVLLVEILLVEFLVVEVLFVRLFVIDVGDELVAEL